MVFYFFYYFFKRPADEINEIPKLVEALTKTNFNLKVIKKKKKQK